MHVLSWLSSTASRDNDECLLHVLAASRRDEIGDMAAKREGVMGGLGRSWGE